MTLDAVGSGSTDPLHSVSSPELFSGIGVLDSKILAYDLPDSTVLRRSLEVELRKYGVWTAGQLGEKTGIDADEGVLSWCRCNSQNTRNPECVRPLRYLSYLTVRNRVQKVW